MESGAAVAFALGGKVGEFGDCFQWLLYLRARAEGHGGEICYVAQYGLSV